jgi:hypothetical protein
MADPISLADVARGDLPGGDAAAGRCCSGAQASQHQTINRSEFSAGARGTPINS